MVAPEGSVVVLAINTVKKKKKTDSQVIEEKEIYTLRGVCIILRRRS